MSNWNVRDLGEKIVAEINGDVRTYFDINDIPSTPTKQECKAGSGTFKVLEIHVINNGDDKVTALRDRHIATIGAQEGTNALLSDFQVKFNNIS
jgi:hypothetical protein